MKKSIKKSLSKKQSGGRTGRATVVQYDFYGNPIIPVEETPAIEPYTGSVGLQVGNPSSPNTRGIGLYQANTPQPTQPVEPEPINRSSGYMDYTTRQVTPNLNPTPRSVSFNRVVDSSNNPYFSPILQGDWGSQREIEQFLQRNVPDSYGGIPVDRDSLQMSANQYSRMNQGLAFSPYTNLFNFANGGQIPENFNYGSTQSYWDYINQINQNTQDPISQSYIGNQPDIPEINRVQGNPIQEAVPQHTQGITPGSNGVGNSAGAGQAMSQTGLGSGNVIGAAQQVFGTVDGIVRGVTGLNQDLAKGAMHITSALSSELNPRTQKTRSIREAFDTNDYGQGYNRMYKNGGLLEHNGSMTDANLYSGPNINDLVVNPQFANAEVEKGEVLLTPSGNTIPIEGVNTSKHYEGNQFGTQGTPIDAPDNSFVFSDRRIKGEDPKLNKMVASDLLNKKVKKSMTMADIAKKFDNTKYDGVLNNTRSTPIQKRTAAINKEMNVTKLQQLADYQESYKLLPEVDPSEFQDGGRIVDERDVYTDASGRIIFPEGYGPNVAQGTLDANNVYTPPQPTQQNYLNPRYMFVEPIVAAGNSIPSSINNVNAVSDSITPMENLNTGLSVNNNFTPQQRTIPSSIRPVTNNSADTVGGSTTTPTRRSILGDVDGSKLLDGASNFIQEGIGWAQNNLDSAMGALPGLVGLLSDVPVIANPTELQRLPNETRDSTQSRLLANQIQSQMNNRARFGNPALQQAYDAQLVSNAQDVLERAGAQEEANFRQRQRSVNAANIEISNREEMLNSQDRNRVNQQLMQKDHNKIVDIQTALNNAYMQRMGSRRDSNTLNLLNQMTPNYNYSRNTGEFRFVQDSDGNTFVTNSAGQLIPVDNKDTKKKKSVKNNS